MVLKAILVEWILFWPLAKADLPWAWELQIRQTCHRKLANCKWLGTFARCWKVYLTLRWVTIKMEGSYPQWQLNVVQNVQGKFPSCCFQQNGNLLRQHSLRSYNFQPYQVLSLKECKRNLLSARKAKRCLNFRPTWGFGLRTSGHKKLRNPGHFCLWPSRESLALESGTQLKESGIPLTMGIRCPSSIYKVWNPVPGILNPRREIRSPILSWIKYLYGFPYICRELK